LAAHLDPHETRALPATGAQRGVGRWDMASECQKQCHRMLGSCNDVAGRRVDHHNALPAGCLDIDVVDSDARTCDYAQTLSRLDYSCGDVRLTAHHECIVVSDHLDQLLLAKSMPFVYRPDASQRSHALRSDRVRH